MLAEFINASEWTSEQWLAAIILAFVIIAGLVMVYRMYTLFLMARKKPYKPNLRPLRRTRYRKDEE